MATKKSQPIDGLVLQRKASGATKPAYVSTKAERQAAVVRANQPKKLTSNKAISVSNTQSPSPKPSLTNPVVPQATSPKPVAIEPAPAKSKSKWRVVVLVILVAAAILLLVAGLWWVLQSATQ